MTEPGEEGVKEDEQGRLERILRRYLDPSYRQTREEFWKSERPIRSLRIGERAWTVEWATESYGCYPRPLEGSTIDTLIERTADGFKVLETVRWS
jgi:hypothetical protein